MFGGGPIRVATARGFAASFGAVNRSERFSVFFAGPRSATMSTPIQPSRSPHAQPARFFPAPILCPATTGATQKIAAKSRNGIVSAYRQRLSRALTGQSRHRPDAADAARRRLQRELRAAEQESGRQRVAGAGRVDRIGGQRPVVAALDRHASPAPLDDHSPRL